MREVARFICECCADGVNKKSSEIFSVVTHHLNRETAVKRHFATYSQNLMHTLHEKILRDLSSFSGILFSWPNM